VDIPSAAGRFWELIAGWASCLRLNSLEADGTPGRRPPTERMDEVTVRFLEVRDELLRLMARRLGHAQAEDLLQEVWVRLHERSDPSLWREPRAVIFRTAVNLAVDLHRRRSTAGKALALQDPDSRIVDPEAQADAMLRVQRLVAALDGLPPQAREAFLLNRIDNLTHEQIARRLGVSTKTVQRHIQRALRACVHVIE
jgi:RNA polymerase sigma-70 factor (ECF subfamily)